VHFILYNLLALRLFDVRAREDALQRLFSTFPGGRPGVGLLLLRTALGSVAVALGVSELSGPIVRTPLVWSVAFTLLIGGVGLIVGFLTPFASALVGLSVLGMALAWLPAPQLASLGVTLTVVMVLATATGVALLGPGAFSIDGQLFGRREIVIPPRQPEP
jgi:uncharacterized membrane protein YphA (DoxX/SURF4 family)